MNIREAIESRIVYESNEERELMDAACRICELMSVDEEKVENMLSEAVDQYKSSQYNMLEKTIDSLARLFGLTTQPSDADKINIPYKFDDTEVTEQLLKLDRGIKSLVEQADRARQERDDARREENRFARSLNAANDQLARLVTQQTEREKNLIANLQLILAEKGKDWQHTDEDAIGRIMDDFGLEVVWDAAGRADCFSRFMISDPALVGIKHPAMLKDGRLVRNGVVFALEVPAEEAPQPAEPVTEATEATLATLATEVEEADEAPQELPE